MKNKAVLAENKTYTISLNDSISDKSKNKNISKSLSGIQDFESKLFDIDLVKPRNSFMIYLKNERKSSEYSTTQHKNNFNNLPENEKSYYIDLAKADKLRYENNLQLVHDNLIKKPEKENKSGCQFFIDEQVNIALKNKQNLSKAKINAVEKWNHMNSHKKEKYFKMSEENKELYKKFLMCDKKFIAGYSYFLRDTIAKGKIEGIKYKLEDIGNLWNDQTQETKKKYEEFALEIKKEIDKNKDLAELVLNRKPKKSLNAYNHFVQDQSRKGLMHGYHTMKEVLEKWRNLPEADKEPYNRQAKKDKLIYLVKKDNFNKMIKKEKVRAPCAYNLFVSETSANKNLKKSEVSCLWVDVDDDTKEEYFLKAEELKEKYSIEADLIKDRIYEKPKKIFSAYMFFFKINYKKFREKKSYLKEHEVMKETSERWSELSYTKKKVYVDMEDEDRKIKNGYHDEYQAKGYYIKCGNDEFMKKKRSPRKDEGKMYKITKKKKV